MYRLVKKNVEIARILFKFLSGILCGRSHSQCQSQCHCQCHCQWIIENGIGISIGTGIANGVFGHIKFQTIHVYVSEIWVTRSVPVSSKSIERLWLWCASLPKLFTTFLMAQCSSKMRNFQKRRNFDTLMSMVHCVFPLRCKAPLYLEIPHWGRHYAAPTINNSYCGCACEAVWSLVIDSHVTSSGPGNRLGNTGKSSENPWFCYFFWFSDRVVNLVMT